MGEVLYHGKKYYEPDRRAQQALVSAGIYSFRYYPKDRLVVASDLTVENFGCEKFYDPMPEGMVDHLIMPEDRTLFENLFEKVDMGEQRVSTTVRNRMDRSLMRVTITITDWDEDGKPDYFAGSIRNHGLVNSIDPLTGFQNQYGLFEHLNVL